MAQHHSYRKGSRDTDWGAYQEGSPLTIEQINCGSQLRIADAVEKMASSYDVLRKDRDAWRERYEARSRSIAYLQHQVAGLRGAIKRMKKQAKKA